MLKISNIVSQIDSFVWGPVMLVLLVGTGVLLTVRCNFLTWRNLPWALKKTLSKEARTKSRGTGDVSPFSALTTALAATIGTGNIVGVATAMVSGGAGALVWMWISACFGLSSKFSECMLAIKYREVNEKGEMSGGPMYTMKKGLKNKKLGAVLGWLFALFAVIASFGIGNMTQGNSIAEALSVTFQVKQTVTGIVLSLLTILVILGGIGTIAKVTEYLVPCMAVFYLFGTGMVIFTHFKNLPAGVVQILWGAFCPEAMTGGAAGMMLAVENGIANSGRMAMRYGVSRGVFSNEAGLGAAGISAAAADTSDAVHQGYISMTGVFIDTIVICSLTGLAIAASGMLGQRDPRGEVLNGTALMIAVFSDTFGITGEWMLTISIVLFAFATIIAWEYQGEKAFEYLTGGCDRTQWYRLGYGLVTFLGAVCSLEAVWDFSDICNGLMAVPNLLAVLTLSRGICREIRKYNFQEI